MYLMTNIIVKDQSVNQGILEYLKSNKIDIDEDVHLMSPSVEQQIQASKAYQPYISNDINFHKLKNMKSYSNHTTINQQNGSIPTKLLK